MFFSEAYFYYCCLALISSNTFADLRKYKDKHEQSIQYRHRNQTELKRKVCNSVQLLFFLLSFNNSKCFILHETTLSRFWRHWCLSTSKAAFHGCTDYLVCGGLWYWTCKFYWLECFLLWSKTIGYEFSNKNHWHLTKNLELRSDHIQTHKLE